MCWEQSPPKRTIATSRSEATTTEPEPENETNGRTQESPGRMQESNSNLTPGAIRTQQPREKPFPLDKLFQERSHRQAQTRPCSLRAPVGHPDVSLYQGIRRGGREDRSRHDRFPEPSALGRQAVRLRLRPESATRNGFTLAPPLRPTSLSSTSLPAELCGEGTWGKRS